MYFGFEYNTWMDISDSIIPLKDDLSVNIKFVNPGFCSDIQVQSQISLWLLWHDDARQLK